VAKNSKMNAKQFGLWIEEQAGTQCRQGKGRTDCVVNIDHIEAGHFAALYAVDSPTGLLVVELEDTFASEAEAWQALQDESSPAHPPQFYTEWVGEQYLTDRTAQVVRFAI
jgi:hypothetical protein